MHFGGLQKSSLIDYPGNLSSVIFLSGCNFDCPFCHNPPLVIEPGAYPDIDPQEILAALEERKAFIDGIVVSGGEPTLAVDLADFLTDVKALGLDVKLDTNGLAPQIVGDLVGRGLVDYLAIEDINRAGSDDI